jgi:hypothetical protein
MRELIIFLLQRVWDEVKFRVHATAEEAQDQEQSFSRVKEQKTCNHSHEADMSINTARWLGDGNNFRPCAAVLFTTGQYKHWFVRSHLWQHYATSFPASSSASASLRRHRHFMAVF